MAESCVQSGEAPSEFAILIGRHGEIHMVVQPDWPLEALRTDRGAEMAFRVKVRHGHVAVEGVTAGRSCRFASETPAAVARRLLNATPWCAPRAALTAAS